MDAHLDQPGRQRAALDKETNMNLWYDPKTVSEDLDRALTTLAAEYPISARQTDGGCEVRFEQGAASELLSVRTQDGSARVTYQTVPQACRGAGLLLGLADGGTISVDEQPGFGTMGLMLDCSRNAVMHVPAVKKWLRRMALAGLNMLMLYTEDTYELPGEPMFGYMRGAYTFDEIREIDDYAAALGIEVIPCIQTLGHLEQILKWRSAYGAVRDTSSVLLVDEHKTYELIGKMVRTWHDAVRSRRIHIGMDETHDLGRGRYMDLHGYVRGFDIFNQHLSKVVEICQAEGMAPMIWSDMYFRMASKSGGYYDEESEVPADVAASIPGATELVYWDYYHTDERFYHEWIRRHREMGFEPVMGSGVWSWGRFVYSHVYTEETALPCIQACLEEGVNEIFFTMWKDDGAAVDFDSALAGVLFVAEASYGGGKVDEERWRLRFEGVCKANLAANLAMCNLDPAPHYGREVNTRMLLWDDPLFGMYRRSLLVQDETRDFDPETYYSELADALSAWVGRDSGQAGTVPFAAQMARVLSAKEGLYDHLRAAYTEADKAVLAELAETAIPDLIAQVKHLWELHRQVWMAQNKALGFEVQCVRYGGLIQRLEEAALRIQEYVSGDLAEIEELEIPFEPLYAHFGRYHSVVTPSSIL
jgi:hexosaminidase